jgi:hypothetical protein
MYFNNSTGFLHEHFFEFIMDNRAQCERKEDKRGFLFQLHHNPCKNSLYHNWVHHNWVVLRVPNCFYPVVGISDMKVESLKTLDF